MTSDDFLNRRIPLAIALALMTQAATVVWWAASRDADLHFHTQRLEHLEQHAATDIAAQSDMAQRLARIEERVNATAATLDRIDKHLGKERR